MAGSQGACAWEGGGIQALRKPTSSRSFLRATPQQWTADQDLSTPSGTTRTNPEGPSAHQQAEGREGAGHARDSPPCLLANGSNACVITSEPQPKQWRAKRTGMAAAL